MNSPPQSPKEDTIIIDTGSSPSPSPLLHFDSFLNIDQVQPAPHPIVTKARHGIHKPNSRYALVLECGAIPDEPRSVKTALQHDGWR